MYNFRITFPVPVAIFDFTLDNGGQIFREGDFREGLSCGGLGGGGIVF